MIKDDRPPSRVLVELDALLDTRLATLSRMDQQAAVACLKDPRYFGRQIDDFTEVCGVGRAAFLDAYRQRDVQTLEASTMTEIPLILAELTMKLEADIVDTPFASEIVVEVNCHPYVLDAEEKEAVALGVAGRCGQKTRVVCVDLPPSELTPSFIKDRYSGIILYNFRDWMEVQMENFKTHRMPRVSVLAPALHHDKVAAPDEFSRTGVSPEISIFQLTEIGMVEMFALSLLPPVNFSIARIPGLHVEPAQRRAA